MVTMRQFSDPERHALLAVKGVGPTVIARLEQMGIATMTELAHASAADVTAHAAARTGSTCWKNSPQARSAIEGAIAAARSWVGWAS